MTAPTVVLVCREALAQALALRHHPRPQIMLCDPPGRLARIVAMEAAADDAADDAVDHDCAPREIVARLQSLLRRGALAREQAPERASVATLPAPLRFAGWTWDPLAADLTSPQGQRVELTPAERRLLAHFPRRAHSVCTRDDLHAIGPAAGLPEGADATAGPGGYLFDASVH